MSRFVEECQKEWNRLGVSQATANEMAADLELDLAEAEADGVSPEEVLGNGYFDARAFAREWASARGVVDVYVGERKPVQRVRVRPLVLAASALACVIAAGLGLLMVVGIHTGSVSLAVVSLRRAVPRPLPGMFFRGGQFGASGPGPAFVVLGLILLFAGLLGGGITLWFWRARAARVDRSEMDRSIGMPTYL
jgi:hypothetical protein